MNDNVIIRPYVDADYKQVKTVLKEAESFDSTWDTRERLKNKIKQDPKSILVAEIDNKVIGSIYIINDARFAGIFRLAVMKDYRGRDIGLTLLKKAEKYLKDKGHPQVMLFVNKKFDKLIDWYKKHDYQHTDNNFKALWKDL